MLDKEHHVNKLGRTVTLIWC